MAHFYQQQQKPYTVYSVYYTRNRTCKRDFEFHFRPIITCCPRFIIFAVVVLHFFVGNHFVQNNANQQIVLRSISSNRIII